MISMIQSFADRGTEDVFNGEDTKAARKTCPQSVWPVAIRKLTQINAVSAREHLAGPPGNRLKGARSGQHSIRINDQYRVCFRWADDGAHDVEITDYH
jgi:toxin HigB-1